MKIKRSNLALLMLLRLALPFGQKDIEAATLTVDLGESQQGDRG